MGDKYDGPSAPPESEFAPSAPPTYEEAIAAAAMMPNPASSGANPYPSIPMPMPSNTITTAPPPQPIVPRVNTVPTGTAQPGVILLPTDSIYEQYRRYQPSVGRFRTKVRCPSCNHEVKTYVSRSYKPGAHVACMVLFIIGCCLCSCLPYCIPSCATVHHFCPNCHSFVGTCPV